MSILKIDSLFYWLKVLIYYKRMEILATCPLDKKEFHIKTEDTSVKNVLELLGYKYGVKGGVLFFDEKKIPLDYNLKKLNYTINDKVIKFTYYPNFLYPIKIKDEIVNVEAKSLVSKNGYNEDHKPLNKKKETYFLEEKPFLKIKEGLFVVAKSNDPESETFAETIVDSSFDEIFTKEDINLVKCPISKYSVKMLNLGAYNCLVKYMGMKDGKMIVSDWMEFKNKYKMVLSKNAINEFDWLVCYSLPLNNIKLMVNGKEKVLDSTKYYSPLSGEDIDPTLGPLNELPEGWLCYEEELLEWCETNTKCPKTGKSIL